MVAVAAAVVDVVAAVVAVVVAASISFQYGVFVVALFVLRGGGHFQ